MDEEVDEEFEKELAALMTDFKLPPSGRFPQAAASVGMADRQEGADAGSTVSFRVMMKRAGRDDRSKAVHVCPGSVWLLHILIARPQHAAYWHHTHDCSS